MYISSLIDIAFNEHGKSKHAKSQSMRKHVDYMGVRDSYQNQ